MYIEFNLTARPSVRPWTVMVKILLFNSLTDDKKMDLDQNESIRRQQIKRDLALSQTIPGFTCLQHMSLENSVGKGEIARNEQFPLFPTVFSILF